MKVSRRAVTLALATAVVALSQTGAATASDWPNRPVTILVPLAAGGNTDLMARMAAEHLTKKFGQPFVVENRPSAGGALTSTQVSTAAPDGYTMLFAPHSMVLLTPLVQKVGFDPSKLVPVTNVGTGSQVAAVKRSLPIKNLAEFLAYAKANPGKLNFAIAGANNISHLGPVLLFKRAGVELVMVPSRGEPAAISDLMAGNVDFYFGNASVLLQHSNHEKIRILAAGTEKRIPAAPDLPTISETFPGFVFASWNGFFVPAGTPDDVTNKLRNEVIAFVKAPDMSKKLTNLGIVPGGMTKQEVEATFKQDKGNFAEAVKAAGITAPK
jgi:tripartite-type tricarboxylate transporter receptor subunit TctC